jgi:hydroxymethylglutaryl-CoA reductase
MRQSDRFAPRALLLRASITIAVTPGELSLLIAALQSKAERAAEDLDQVDYADYVFQRIAALREAGR